MILIKSRRKYNFYSNEKKSDKLDKSLVSAVSSVLKEVLGGNDSDYPEGLINVLPKIQENVEPEEIKNAAAQSTESVVEAVFSKKYSNLTVNKNSHKYLKRKNYASSKISKFISELGYTGAAKALTGSIMSAFANLSTVPYLGPVLETLGESVIKPTMLAIPGSLFIYTLVKKGLLDPIKYNTGKKKIEKILKEKEKETGCISIDNVEQISEEIASIFVSGKNSPITKILEWVKTEMIKDKKAKNEEEAYKKIVEAFAEENTEQSEK
ncbi:MAG: hypothetical protein QXF12_00040 [Candidatus Aenigmatarchaeota archaeon]